MVTVARARVDMPSNAGLLAMKLIALVVMVADHVDWLLYGSVLGIHDTAGRLVFPVFVYVLALNLTRPGDPLRLFSVAGRMAGWGVLASAVYVPLAGFLPLNVLFTLAAGVAIVAAIRAGWWIAATAAFLSAGLLVDYQWFGLACIVGTWWALQRGVSPFWIATGMMVLLVPINQSTWAWLSFPVLVLGHMLAGDAPRLKWLFYAVYPVHLAVLALLSRL